jgi:hypothetical protein
VTSDRKLLDVHKKCVVDNVGESAGNKPGERRRNTRSHPCDDNSSTAEDLGNLPNGQKAMEK